MRKVLVVVLLALSPVFSYGSDSYFSGEISVGSTLQTVYGNSEQVSTYGIRGAYNLNPYIGIELAYKNYGTTEDVFGSAQTSALNLSLKSVLHLQNRFSLNARLGVASWSVDESPSSGSTGLGFEYSGYGLYFGMGGQYAVNRTLNIGIEFAFVDTSEFFDSETNSLDLIAGFKF